MRDSFYVLRDRLIERRRRINSDAIFASPHWQRTLADQLDDLVTTVNLLIEEHEKGKP